MKTTLLTLEEGDQPPVSLVLQQEQLEALKAACPYVEGAVRFLSSAHQAESEQVPEALQLSTGAGIWYCSLAFSSDDAKP